MAIPRRSWRRLVPVLGFLILGLVTPGRCRAQFGPSGGFSDPFSDLGFSGMQQPQPTPQGEWAQVLTATPRWLVLQNQKGQQFPVSTAEIRSFLIRWPTTLDRLAPGTLVEATGPDLGTNQLQTDHVDVYEGTAQQLGIAPTVETIVGFNRILTSFDVDQQNTYGFDMFRMLSPAELQMPRRLHVVGPLVGLNPIRIEIGGNIAVAVLPMMGQFSVTSVTPGSASFVREGDLVYATPAEARPRGLLLSRLVVYKTTPLNQAVAPAPAPAPAARAGQGVAR